MLWILYGIIVIYSGLDAWQTYMLIEAGVAYEANPILSYLIDGMGFWAAICLVKGLALGFLALTLIIYQRGNKNGNSTA